MGGTWWKNAYPGAAVDVQSYLYSLSFEDYDWTRLFAHQDELLDYTNHIIDKYGLAEKSLTNAPVAKLVYDESTCCWKIETQTGNTYLAENIINASGGLSQVKIPTFEGQDSFAGATMHTSEWDQDYDYRNKRVAIIGTGASATQVIPAIADKVAHLSIFQRTPHWILKRPDRVLKMWERKLHQRFPFIRKAHRSLLYWKFESRLVAFRFAPKLFTLFPQWEAKRHIKQHITDPELIAKLTPDFMIGCKRVLVNSDYYPTLKRDNVTLFTKENQLQSVTPKGIRTTQGQEVEVDLIVYATGFHASENMIAYPVIGREGRSLDMEWETGAHAYLGATVPYFPNLYLLGGPNTGIGHTSYLYMLEAQLEYVMQMLRKKEKENIKSIEIKEEPEKRYNEQLQKEMAKTVWQTGGCESWYQTEDGKNTTLYPNFTFKFRRDCVNARLEDHILVF